MNKQQALERLDALENEAKSLRDIINTPEKIDSLLIKPVPQSSERYFTLTNNIEVDGFCAVPLFAQPLNTDFYSGGNSFQSEEIAEVYAKALNTFLLLRHQPGTEIAIDGKQQWIIEVEVRGQGVYVEDWNSIGLKMNHLSPTFNSFKYAGDAIKNVGVDNIMHMFKTFHGIYE